MLLVIAAAQRTPRAGPSNADAEERGAFGAGRVHHRAHVVHALFEMGDADMPVGETGAALVEQNQAGKSSEAGKEMGTTRIFPKQLDIGDKTRNEDQVEPAAADHLVGDVDIAALGVAGFRRHRGPPC